MEGQLAEACLWCHMSLWVVVEHWGCNGRVPCKSHSHPGNELGPPSCPVIHRWGIKPLVKPPPLLQPVRLSQQCACVRARVHACACGLCHIAGAQA